MADGRPHELNLEQLLGVSAIGAASPRVGDDGREVAALLAARVDLSRRVYWVGEFLYRPSAEFIACIYTALFRRPPDTATFLALRDQLLSGETSRIAMLRSLRKSASGNGAFIFGVNFARLRSGVQRSAPARAARSLARLARNLRRLPKNIRQFVARVETLERFMTQLQASGAFAQTGGPEKDRLMASFYGSFEDKFRGERDDIKARHAVFLRRVKACVGATGGGPVIDLGFGRGEWLELLGEHGISACGYDSNEASVRECRSRGLDVRLGDALSAMRNCATGSASVVTGFHIIEHMPFEVLLQLADEVLRVLRPGGLLLFETPNPGNLLVAAERFYMDPTHRNPLPAEMIAYSVASRGFENTEIVKLHPVPWASRSYDDPMLELLQDKLFGAQDYAVIGSKPW